MFETAEDVASRYDATTLENILSDITEMPARAGAPRREFSALLIPVTSAGITFQTRPNGTIDRMHGCCPSCGRTQSARPLDGNGYGTGPVPAYRHLRRVLDQPQRGTVGRALRRVLGCGCRTRIF